MVSRCPALGVTVQTLLHELPQVLLLYWHWKTTWHSKKLSSSINPNSRMEKLTYRENIHEGFPISIEIIGLGYLNIVLFNAHQQFLLNHRMEVQCCASRDQDGYSWQI